MATPTEEKSRVKIERIIGKETKESAEILVDSIEAIARAMAAISKTRLTRRAIVTLIHAECGVARRDIDIVLTNLDELEKKWLK